MFVKNHHHCPLPFKEPKTTTFGWTSWHFIIVISWNAVGQFPTFTAPQFSYWGNWWFGFLVSSYERDCCLALKSQTTNFPWVDQFEAQQKPSWYGEWPKKNVTPQRHSNLQNWMVTNQLQQFLAIHPYNWRASYNLFGGKVRILT